MKRLGGLDLTLHQIEGLVACFGASGKTMTISKQRLAEAKLSEGEIKDLLAKGYLEEIDGEAYLMPASSFDSAAFTTRLRTESNKEMIRQMSQGMFGSGDRTSDNLTNLPNSVRRVSDTVERWQQR